MTGSAIPEDSGIKAASQAPLRCLKKLHLTGNFRCVFRLLDRLVLPNTLDYMSLTLLDSTVEGVSQVLRPYLGDYPQRSYRLQNRLGIDARSIRNYLSIRADTVGEPHLWTPFQSVTTVCDIQGSFGRGNSRRRTEQPVSRPRRIGSWSVCGCVEHVPPHKPNGGPTYHGTER